MDRYLLNVSLLVLVVTAACARPGTAGEPVPAKAAIVEDKVVAGGPKDFMEVRHLVLKGTNEEIGRALATIARERYQAKPDPGADRLRTRVQRRYLSRHYPILLDRMRGVAAAFGRRLEDDAFDFGGLTYLTGTSGGCSVVYYPPAVTAAGNGVLSRNYEYSTGTADEKWPRRGELPANARPYLIEMHPDRGYPSLALCAYDLLSGVLDGINSEGLTVAMLADDELEEKFKMEAAEEGGVGLGVQQVLRMLLDTCANVDEAKEALLLTKQYYEFIPNHYLIADRHGKAFVWEYSQAHNREYVVENPGKPLISTNFSLHRHLEGKEPPSAKAAKAVCPRYCVLAERIGAARGKLTEEFIRETHKAVEIALPAWFFAPRPPVRTLWHALYVPERRQVQVSFYLGEGPDPAKPGRNRILRSEYLRFTLKDAKAAP
jgi:hypothetical protein